ncbi:helix-turn-helix transcriptional regulator [Nocardioides sp. CFH 31398]|uniref:helix-turn-helix transcriptional regulator n=1 Tax=Nocardioides sp. CFH 31398 TaxID=2919579 RepID=UPI001F0674E6|nr:helix-turn-helix transcriptional regulator [Nocardioides sp. CFH 31398]MCH1867996.1 helix-turn-helix transcriptional regulator [Nocardioides sp. CFH 31398]
MDQFGAVLRSWRDRVTPQEVGLPPGPGRRAPGLRREELAGLAGMSVEYLVRLEQGRATHPSTSVLAALARALRLTDDERDHLYRVAGQAPPATGAVSQHVGPGVQRVVDRLSDVPAAVFSAAWDLVWWNAMWAALTGDPSERPPGDRNVALLHFLGEPRTIVFDAAHDEEFSDDLAADLREALGRYPDDPRLAGLVARLRRESPAFERRWERAHVARHRSSRKTATATPVGPIDLDCDVLTAPGSDLRIVVYTVAPGSEAASRMELLRVVGARTLT